MNKDKFCREPFVHIYSEGMSSYRACCRARRSDDKEVAKTHVVTDMSPMEWYKSDEMEKIRDIFLNDPDPSTNPKTNWICKDCWKLEDKGVKSRREMFGNNIEVMNEVIDNVSKNGSYELPDTPSLEVKLRIFGNQCNFSCIMCSPKNSNRRGIDLAKMDVTTLTDSGWGLEKLEAKTKVVKDFNKINRKDAVDRFINKDIHELGPHTRVFQVIGGEPMIMLDHYKVLDAFVEHGYAENITLTYVSNVSKFDVRGHNFFDYIDKFKAIHITASIDGIEEYAEYIRQYSDWDDVANNLFVLRSTPGVSMSVTSTISALSVLRIDEMMDFFVNDLKLEPGAINMYSNVIIYPKFLRINNLPEKLKDELRVKLTNSKYAPYYKTFLTVLDDPGDEEQRKNLYSYIKEVDKYYGTNARDIWPELAEYGF